MAYRLIFASLEPPFLTYIREVEEQSDLRDRVVVPDRDIGVRGRSLSVNGRGGGRRLDGSLARPSGAH